MNSIANDTVKELYFTEEDLKERLSEIKEDFWGDLKCETLIGVKRLLETSMDVQVQDLIGVKRWEHRDTRKDFRNGYYCRSLFSPYGWINGFNRQNNIWKDEPLEITQNS